MKQPKLSAKQIKEIADNWDFMCDMLSGQASLIRDLQKSKDLFFNALLELRTKCIEYRLELDLLVTRLESSSKRALDESIRIKRITNEPVITLR